MTVVAKMATFLCGPPRPESEMVTATYLPYTEIPAPTATNVSGIYNNPLLCVALDFNVGGSPYIRYTLDGSDPDDDESDGTVSRIWTEEGVCIEIFPDNVQPGTIVTLKAQNYVFLGAGPYVGGDIMVETYVFDG